jgi:hypothetical protein
MSINLIPVGRVVAACRTSRANSSLADIGQNPLVSCATFATPELEAYHERFDPSLEYLSRYTQAAVGAYEHRTREVIELFLNDCITFPECIAALDAALAALIPSLSGEQLPRLRLVMLANNEIVMKEMERRGAG